MSKSQPSYPRKNVSTVRIKHVFAAGEEIQVHHEKGVFSFTDKDGQPYEIDSREMERYYDGANKTRRIVAKATNLPFTTDTVGSWVTNFDCLIAMDTNTDIQTTNGFYIAATAVYFGVSTSIDEYRGRIEAEPILIIDWYRSDKNGFESTAWSEVLKILDKQFPENMKVGVVVDSELGSLEAYNNRTKPLSKDYYLPDKFTLIFATADKSDEWCNKMVRACDKLADKRKDEIRQDPKLRKKAYDIDFLAPIGFISYDNVEKCLDKMMEARRAQRL